MAIGVVLAAIVNAVLIAVAARRLVGVPVGWPRTFLLSLMANSAAGPALRWALPALGLEVGSGDTGQRGALILVSTLAVAWILALEAGALAILEAFVPTGTLPGPWEWLRSLPARWRRGRRYAAIVRIAATHGLGRFLTARGGPADARTPAALRRALTDGGVTFVKLGQMLSTRPDVLPPAYVEELSRLHADVPPQPWALVRETVREELGRDPRAIFASVDEEPLAAASVGQVHRAVLPDGREVVVKVQRSDARAQVMADLDIVGRLAGWLDRATPWARGLGVLDLSRGFAASLEEELDYRVEAGNLSAVRAAVPSTLPVDVPAVHEPLSTRRVLVMDLMDGQPLSRAGAELAGLSAAERESLARGLLDAVLEQLLDGGTFHADLHPGNVLLQPGGRLALLDFGSVGRLDRGARTSLGLLLLAVDRQDAAAAAQALTDLVDAPPTLDDRALERDLGMLIMRFGAGRQGTGEMFVAMLRVVLQHGLSVPPGVAAAFRCLGALDGTLRLLDPRIDLVGVARAQGRSILADRIGPEGIRAELTDQLVQLAPMLQRLPRRLATLVEDLGSGQLTVTVRTLQDEGERRFVTGLVQQVVTAVLAMTAALSGVVLVLWPSGPDLTPNLKLPTFFGLVLLLFAFVLGSRAMALVFRGDHLAGRTGRGGRRRLG